MKYILSLLTLLGTYTYGISQEASMEKNAIIIPYAEIGEYPESYSSGNAIGRFIDGLAYRYYWATDSLTSRDLEYVISEDSRSTDYTLDHIYGLSKFIKSIIYDDMSLREDDTNEEIEWSKKRMLTLSNFKKSSDKIKSLNDKEVSELKIVFIRGDKKTEFPVWHMINGPISDAIYHVGQIVAFRRASGNPLNPNVSVFMGKNRDTSK